MYDLLVLGFHVCELCVTRFETRATAATFSFPMLTQSFRVELHVCAIAEVDDVVTDAGRYQLIGFRARHTARHLFEFFG